MLNDLDRTILQCVIEAEQPVANRVLAIQCGAAVNTIRKEIMLLNGEIEGRYGVRVASKASVGNYLEVVDAAKADRNLGRLRTFFRRSDRIHISENPQVYYLVRRCLCSDGSLTVESLCRELYCSRSTLLRDLNAVRKIIGRFHLTLSNGRGDSGLKVLGKEWDIRQCLIYQHKIYKNITGVEAETHSEYAFKAMFYMQDGEERYKTIREDLDRALYQQTDFTVPFIHLPKIVHYIQLSMSRQKYSDEIQFSQVQTERVVNTQEYVLAQELCAREGKHFGKQIAKNDVIGTAVLLLAYETRNARLPLMREYQELYDETQQLISLMTERWGFDRALYDDIFVRDCICFLYALRNRLIYGVYQDGECVGAVEKKGIGSSDACLLFARFYEERHGIRLSKEDTLSAYYLFHRTRKNDTYCYYAQNILVVTQYGYTCASGIAASIRKNYREEIGLVTPIETNERPENVEDYDLMVTDLEKGRRGFLIEDLYEMPILTVEFLLGNSRSAQLDEYLLKLQKQCELMVLKNECFRRAFLQSREEVFERLAEEICTWRSNRTFSKEEAVTYLRENDAYIELERSNGVVFFPVLTQGWEEQKIAVFLNHKAIRWNESRSQIFVCYNRLRSKRDNHILNNLLQRFVHISALTADELLYDSSRTPVEILYPQTDKS
ncbi:MAG: helix-turn-helix domain-containing protein [Lachnospiraceae bacterium]|nr:helix-turn-helix domain-containing protein [Lachnospiraceae bacterium]